MNYTLKIKSIVEAFSMQPTFYQVSESKEGFWKPDEAIKEIRLEYLSYSNDEVPEPYYSGFNFEGKKLFQYRAKSVNVHYEVNDIEVNL
jgi:hypothetical protein